LTPSPRIELICIGTELLSGKVNSHTALIGKRLNSIGMEIAREHAVGDDPKLMTEVFADAWKRSDIILSAGGLGPTFDDLTRDVWSKITRRPLILKKELVREIEKKFSSRGLKMAPENSRQGYLLQGARPISNPFGTAPGQILKANGKILFVLPGPTNELSPMLESCVLPELRKAYPKLFSVEKSFHLIGISESQINHQIEPLVNKIQKVDGCSVIHGILASQSIITVKFRVDGTHQKIVQKAADRVAAQYKNILGNIYFSEDDSSLPEVVAELLTKRGKKLAVAESCTGGLLSKLITDVSGASKFFLEGAITYANDSKMRRLGVDSEVMNRMGAVSEEVAGQMAQGIRLKAASDYGLSITGVAGPTGATKDKPVGLVFIGVSGPKRTVVHRFLLKGDRMAIRHRSALLSLDLLRKEILGLS